MKARHDGCGPTCDHKPLKLTFELSMDFAGTPPGKEVLAVGGCRLDGAIKTLDEFEMFREAVEKAIMEPDHEARRRAFASWAESRAGAASPPTGGGL